MLILGGTAEAAALAGALVDEGRSVITSLAGATRSPAPIPGEMHVGGFGGAEGLARYLEAVCPAAVVDATHPFAERISASATHACAARRVPLLRLLRAPWRAQEGDRWHPVGDLAAAAAVLPALGRRVFLSLGLRGLAPFAALPEIWFLLRAVDPPERLVTLPAHVLVLGRGPFRVEDELELLERHRIEVLVTRNAGGEGSRAKLFAARRLGLPVVMVARPAPAPGERVEDVAAALGWLARMTHRSAG